MVYTNRKRKKLFIDKNNLLIFIINVKIKKNIKFKYNLM